MKDLKMDMKISANLFLGLILLAVCSCGINEIYNHQSAKSVPNVSVTLTPSASTYDLYKVSQGIVGFSASIKNDRAETITIAHPSMCLPRDNFEPGQIRHFTDNHGKSEILLVITKPDDTNVILRDGWMHGFDPHNVFHLTIPPGKTQSFYLGWFFQNARGRWENDAEAATVFLDKGTYKVKLIFRNALPWAFIYNKDADKTEIKRVWTGAMQSEEVSIDIK